MTVSKSSLYMRLFLWAWGADPEKLNICKLFWGTIFLPLAFFREKPVWGFVPRETILYSLLAPLIAVLGYPGFATGMFLAGVLFFLVFVLWTKLKGPKKQSEDEKQQGKVNQDLSEVTSFGSSLAERFLGRLFRVIYAVLMLPPLCYIGGIVGIVRDYSYAVKERLCLEIQVE